MPKQKSISSSQIANQWNEDKIALNHLTLFSGNVISKKKNILPNQISAN